MTRSSRVFRSGETGLSMVELMVALAIGSLLMLGLVQVFAASRAAYVTSEGMSRVQENARFAMDYLQRDIRMAGHFGCVNDQAHWVTENMFDPNDPSVVVPVADRGGGLVSHLGQDDANHPLNFNVSIYGYEATDTAPDGDVTLGAATTGWSPGLPTQISSLDPLPGSDIIALRFFSSAGVPVTSLAPAGTGTLTSFASGDEARAMLTSEGDASPQLFGVSDCSRGDVFQASAVNLAAGTVTSPAGASFAGQYTAHPSGLARLYRADSIVYYVALNTADEPALFRARFNGVAYVPEELVEGIESLQFLYGRDQTANISMQTPPSGSINRQDPANELGDDRNEWLGVGLVQVGLLARSPNASAVEAPTDEDLHPRVLGVRFDPPATSDARYRSSYETTVALRNRLFGN